jgi:hypothetical protein
LPVCIYSFYMASHWYLSPRKAWWSLTEMSLQMSCKYRPMNPWLGNAKERPVNQLLRLH